MSRYLHYQIARGGQQGIVNGTIKSHPSAATPTTVNRHRRVKHRLVQIVAALGVCVAAGTAVTVSDAQSNQRPMNENAGQISAQQLAREINVFEAKGYVPTSCIVGGTLMRNYSTGQSVTVRW